MYFKTFVPAMRRNLSRSPIRYVLFLRFQLLPKRTAWGGHKHITILKVSWPESFEIIRENKNFGFHCLSAQNSVSLQTTVWIVRDLEHKTFRSTLKHYSIVATRTCGSVSRQYSVVVKSFLGSEGFKNAKYVNRWDYKLNEF